MSIDWGIFIMLNFASGTPHSPRLVLMTRAQPPWSRRWCGVAGGVSPSDSRRSRRDAFSSPGFCHRDQQEPCAHAQWAKSIGYVHLHSPPPEETRQASPRSGPPDMAFTCRRWHHHFGTRICHSPFRPRHSGGTENPIDQHHRAFLRAGKLLPERRCRVHLDQSH